MGNRFRRNALYDKESFDGLTPEKKSRKLPDFVVHFERLTYRLFVIF